MDKLKERASGRILSARLEVRDELIRSGEIEQENYILLEFDGFSETADGIEIWMDAGVGDTDLTTDTRMNEIRCQTGNGWTVEKNVAESGSISWIISREEAAKGQYTRLPVLFQSVIVYRAGTCRVHFCYHFGKTDGSHSYVEVEKTDQELRIEGFYPQPGTLAFAQDEVLLIWCTLGADYCLLNPGNRKVAPIGNLKVKGSEGMRWTLTAIRGQESVERSIRLFTYEDVPADYIQIWPRNYYLGGTDELNWNVDADKLVITGGNKRWEVPAKGNMTVENGCYEYVFHRWKDGFDREVVYTRPQHDDWPVIIFGAGIIGGNISVKGGHLYSLGLDGAGIGGGIEWYTVDFDGIITVTNGEVYAKGSSKDGAAGIGVGSPSGGSFKGTVDISGGTVMAYGDKGAGIGITSNNKNFYGAVQVSGGEVHVKGDGLYTPIVRSYYDSCRQRNATINITGGNVYHYTDTCYNGNCQVIGYTIDMRVDEYMEAYWRKDRNSTYITKKTNIEDHFQWVNELKNYFEAIRPEQEF